jgi:uncharacterized protein YbjT (DUF2867 family)
MILITGASGTIGREVVKALAGRKVQVRAGYRTRPGNVPAGVEPVALDYDRPETLRPALAGVETVFLLSSTVQPERHVVDEARRAGARRIVKLSVFGADNEGFLFAGWHRAAERYVEASGLDWTFLRPNSFMQNVINYMGETIRTQSALYSSAAQGAISAVDARDVGRVAAHVLTETGHEGRAYELTGPGALTYFQVADVLSEVLARPIRYVPVSHEQYKQSAMAAGTPEAYADALVDLNRYQEAGKMSRVSPVVRQVTGQAPIAFEEFARDHAESLR